MSWISQEHAQQVENDVPTTFVTEEAPFEPVGEEVQRLSVIQSLPDLLEGDNVLCMQRVLPKVQQALPQASAEFHLAASSTFYTILERKLVHPRTFTQTFLHSIVSNLESKDPVVANAWLETLLDVMDLLPTEVIRQDILPVAINKGQLNQPTSSRLASTKLLGKVALRFETYTMKKDALPLVQSLCQDVNHDVRASMCTELTNVAKGLGSEGCKVTLLPSLVELANDEEAKVRLAALNTIVEIMPHLQTDVMKSTMVPLLKKMCSQALAVEDMVLGGTSFQLGKICLGLDAYLNMSEKRWFMSHYQQLAQLGVSNLRKDFIKGHGHSVLHEIAADAKSDLFILVRQHCAYNFPAIAVFSTKQGDVLKEQLYSTFCDLTCDPYFLVRRTIACGIHEVAHVLGPSCGMVKNELVKLLMDDSDEVLQGLIPNIAMTLEQLAKTGNIGPDNIGSQVMNDSTALEIGRALVKCEEEVSLTHNWRLHSELLGQLQCLPNCLPSDFINHNFVPIMLSRIHTARPVPCREAAARTLMVFLRYNQKPSQRSDIRTRINTELCHGRSCYSRMMFVKICDIVIDVYSRRFFKDFYFKTLLELAEDLVPNIRLCVVALLPKLKAMLRLPRDRPLLLILEATVRQMLLEEKDRDVLACLNTVIQKLDKIDVKLETNVGNSPQDIRDQQKYDEECRLGLLKVDPSKKKGDPKRSSNTSSPAPRRTAVGGLSGSVATSSPKDSSVSGASVNRQSLSVPQTKERRVSGGASSYLSKDSLASLEDEFYVDAGIRIPQQLAVTDMTSFPTRIPNVREILFRNRSSTQSTDVKKECDEFIVSSPASKQANSVIRRHSAKSKICVTEQKHKDATVIANRRHSYMDTGRNEIPVLKKGSYSGGNRRHSYIESRTSPNKCLTSVKSLPPKGEVAFKRRSLMFSSPHSQRHNPCETEKKPIRVENNCFNVSKIPLHPQSLALENKRRHSSLERDDLERLKNPERGKSYSIKPNPQARILYSSMERLISSKTRNPQKCEEEFSQGDKLGGNSNLCVFETDLSLKKEKDACELLMSNENVDISFLKKGNRLSLSKIPRGIASCHSSPGGSRASSPTGIPLPGNATRVRQRTAPNSRASSPTGSSSQRLSLGSLNNYMSNLKFAEASSRLPVRKPPS